MTLMAREESRMLDETSVSRWPAGGRFARATTIIVPSIKSKARASRY
jgi:hypothetical protein